MIEINRTIFSDIDGTFLDNDYKINFDAEFLKHVAKKFKIVFVSSRTAAEIVSLQEQVKWEFDFIAENGGVIGIHKRTKALSQGIIYSEETTNHKLIKTSLSPESILHDLSTILTSYELTLKIVIINNITPHRMAELSNYDLYSAKLALDRKASLLLKIEDPNPAILDEFIKLIKNKNYKILYGGRWFSISSGCNKGEAISLYLKKTQNNPNTIGVGNSDNDFELLNSVDLKFIINDAGYNKKLLLIPDAHKLKAYGVKGWEEMINRLLQSK